jgi:hypothetical protein
MTMFNCIKTGFYAKMPSGLFLYGDAFGMPGEDWPDEPVPHSDSYLLLRVTSMSNERPSKTHIVLRTWANWFDELRGKGVNGGIIWQPASTLIASPGQWSWLGYDGRAV